MPSLQRLMRFPFVLILIGSLGGDTFADLPATAPAGEVRERSPMSGEIKLVSAEAAGDKNTYIWLLDCPDEARLLFHGFHSLQADETIAEHVGGGTNRTGNRDRDIPLHLVIETSIDGDKLVVSMGKHLKDRDISTMTAKTDIPADAVLEIVSLPEMKDEQAFTLNNLRYLTLWEGRFVREGQTVKTVRYTVRIGAADDPATGYLAPDDVQETVPLTNASAASPDTNPGKTLRSSELSGTWEGNSKTVQVRVTFRGDDDLHWVVRDGRSTTSARLKRVDDQNFACVHIRCDYTTVATGTAGSAMVGKLEPGEDGTIKLTILPIATDIEASSVVVEKLQMNSLADADPKAD